MEYLEILMRSVVVYAILLVLTRFMGRKQLSQITFFDYVVGITIGSIAASAVVDRTIPLIDGFIAIVVWCVLPIAIGYVALRNIRFRTLVDGKPCIVIQNGVILRENMRKAKYNIGDMLMQLRDKDIFDISEVDFAIFEPNGTLSVLRKPECDKPTRADLNITAQYSGIMAELIIDGRIMEKHLKAVKKDIGWLMGELKSRGISRPDDVVFAGLMEGGQLYVSTRTKSKGSDVML